MDMNKWIKLFNIFGILEKAMASISKELRTSITEGLQKARIAAAKTDNKADDIVVDLLCALFNIPE